MTCQRYVFGRSLELNIVSNGRLLTIFTQLSWLLSEGFFCYKYLVICHFVNLCYALNISQLLLAEELLMFQTYYL